MTQSQIDRLGKLVQSSFERIFRSLDGWEYELDNEDAKNGIRELCLSPELRDIVKGECDTDALGKLEKERDAWKEEYLMYANAWQRELGGVYPKTHLIDALVVTTRALRKKLEAFEEVSKKDYR